MTAGGVWIGRVFTDGVCGGNHTAIVRDARGLPPAEIAARLDRIGYAVEIGGVVQPLVLGELALG